MILAYLAVFLTVELGDLLLAGIDTQTRQVHGVRTHIGNLSVFIQVLGNHHRLTHGEAQFTGSLLLQGRSGEGRCRGTLQRLLADRLYGIGGIDALLQELLHLLVGLQALCQRGLYLRL